jgi:hypothetical protein
MQAPTRTPGWQYEPRRLFPQWDATAQRMSYRHPTPPWLQDHGPTDTWMGYTLAGAQEMCRLENITLAQTATPLPEGERKDG